MFWWEIALLTFNLKQTLWSALEINISFMFGCLIFYCLYVIVNILTGYILKYFMWWGTYGVLVAFSCLLFYCRVYPSVHRPSTGLFTLLQLWLYSVNVWLVIWIGLFHILSPYREWKTYLRFKLGPRWIGFLISPQSSEISKIEDGNTLLCTLFNFWKNNKLLVCPRNAVSVL